MSDNQNNTPKNSRLAKYQEEFDEDVEVNIRNVKDKSMLISSIRAKWIRIYFKERDMLDKLKEAKTVYSRQLANQTSVNQRAAVAFLTPPSVPFGSVELDPGLTKINTELKNSEYCLDFINKAFNVLESFNYQIKNVVDLIKLESN